MSIKRSRTKIKAGEKIQYNIEYGLDSIFLCQLLWWNKY